MIFNFYRQWRRITWPWIASALLLSAIAASAVLDLRELHARDAQADSRISSLERSLLTPLAIQVAKQAQDVTAQLETPERLSLVARDLQALAIQHGLALLDASYKPADDSAHSDMGQVDVRVRLKGAYLPLKKTIAGLLGEHHSLALTSLVLRRTASTDAVLEIDLKFNFYYRKSA